MLAKRIIACLDVRDGRVVKGTKFADIKDVDSPEILADFYSKNRIDELVFYDITASNENRKTSLDFVEKVAKTVNIPFCVGGGVNTVEDFKYILRKGADKVSINSSAVKNPKLIKEAAEAFGNQCVVVSIDAKKNKIGSWNVYINGGRLDTGLDVLSWVEQAQELGAGEFVINSIDEDGMKNGYDIALLKKITQISKVPVIASGGAGEKIHFLEAFENADVDAALAASVFHYKQIEIADLKNYLKQKNVKIRL